MTRLITAGAELGLGLASGDGAVTGTVTRDTAAPRSGAAAWKFDTAATNSPASVSLTVPFTLGQSVFVRAYFRFDTLPATAAPILRFGGTGLPSVRIKSNGSIGLYDPSSSQIGSDSSTVVTAGDGLWYRIEFQLNIGTGAVDSAALVVEGTAVASATAQTWTDTLPSALNMGWINGIGANIVCYADDLAVNDASGSSQTSYPGVGQVVALLPVSTSSAGSWTVGTGGTLAGATSNTPPQGVADVSTVTTQIRSVSTTADDAVALTTETYDSKVPTDATITLVQTVVNHSEGTANGTKQMDSAVTSNPTGSFHTQTPYGGDTGAAGTWPTNWKATFGTPVIAPTITFTSGAVVSVRDKTTNANSVVVSQMALMVEYTGGTPIPTNQTKSILGIASPTAAVGRVDFVQTNAPQSVSIIGIASPALIGLAAIKGSFNFLASGIASGEAVGTLGATPGPTSRSLSGIASGEAVGKPTPAPTVLKSILGIPSGDSVGSPTALSVYSQPILGIASTEDIGKPAVTRFVNVQIAGIASSEQVGTPAPSAGGVSATIHGIASSELVGRVAPLFIQAVSISGIASTDSVGSVGSSTRVSSAISGIAASGLVGTPDPAMTVSVAIHGIASSDDVGIPSTSITVPLLGIPDGSLVGQPLDRHNFVQELLGIPGASLVGVPGYLANVQVAVLGIPSSDRVGRLHHLLLIRARSRPSVAASGRTNPQVLRTNDSSHTVD